MVCADSILVADDDENDVLLLQLAFEKAGLHPQIFVARDGFQAMDYLARIPHRAKLLLLDIKMPGMSGFDVLAWLRKKPQYADLAVVMLSSSNNTEDVRRADELGASEYHTKPGALAGLTALVSDLYARYVRP